MNNKITWKEARNEMLRWLAVSCTGTAAFLIGYGKGIFIPLLFIVGALGFIWLIRGINDAVWVAGTTLLMTGLWGLLVIFEHGLEPIGPFELIPDSWAPYLFAGYFVSGSIISVQLFRAKQ